MSDDVKSPREAWLESYEASRAMLLRLVYGGGEQALTAARDLLALEKERMALN